MSMGSTKSGLVFLGAFLAIGLTMSGYFIGQTLYNGKVAINTAEAKGLAEMTVEADKVEWQINFSRTFRDKSKLSDEYTNAEKDQEKIYQLLLTNGLEKIDLRKGVISFSAKEIMNDKQEVLYTLYVLSGSVAVSTAKVRIVSDELRGKINRLVVDGIEVESNAPAYHFTRLNEIKPQMLEEATKNARIAANEFAKNANAKVGGIRSAEQGSFIVNDEGEQYGDTLKIKKIVRVVTKITFYLKDSQ
jgi:uncharacterized protein